MQDFRLSRRLVARALALAPALALMGFSTRDYVYRYRLTIEVDTTEGLKSGSSVLEISTRETERRVFRKLKGEAVAVDLGARGVLFALLVGRSRNRGVGSQLDTTDLPAKALVRSGKLKGDDPNFESYLANSRDRIELVEEEIPFLVRFKDISDPQSVDSVDPKDLAKSFGNGVTLKRATIDLTDVPVTNGILKQLPWLGEFYLKQLDGSRFETIHAEKRLANSLGAGVFKTELP